jgi:hypothetical protein
VVKHKIDSDADRCANQLAGRLVGHIRDQFADSIPYGFAQR